MIVHLIDGTYELFRQFYGRRHFSKGKDERFGAVSGVLHSILEMIETGATHVGVATDHVIESFRNDLWPDYKTGEGIEPALLAQFQPHRESFSPCGRLARRDRHARTGPGPCRASRCRPSPPADPRRRSAPPTPGRRRLPARSWAIPPLPSP